MSTRKQRADAKERFGRRVVRQWQQSKLSLRPFGQAQGLTETNFQAQGLTESNFHAWRRTLQQRAAEDVAFMPVHVVSE